MVALKPPAGEPLPEPAILGDETYLVGQRGYLFVGATVTRDGFDTSTTKGAAQWLLDHAAALIPSLRGWGVAEHWASLRPGTPDDLPMLGRSVLDDLFIAGGQFRSGILYTPAIAEGISALIAGKNMAFDSGAFDPRRFSGNSR